MRVNAINSAQFSMARKSSPVNNKQYTSPAFKADIRVDEVSLNCIPDETKRAEVKSRFEALKEKYKDLGSDNILVKLGIGVSYDREKGIIRPVKVPTYYGQVTAEYKDFERARREVLESLKNPPEDLNYNDECKSNFILLAERNQRTMRLLEAGRQSTTMPFELKDFPNEYLYDEMDLKTSSLSRALSFYPPFEPRKIEPSKPSVVEYFGWPS